MQEFLPPTETSPGAPSGDAWPDAVCESGGFPPGLRERHLQCLWFDGKYRPANLRDSLGRPVEVVHAGEWNTGPGPDFLNALVRVGDGAAAETLHGDVELHLRAADWLRHGHSRDPRYARVVVHAAYDDAILPDGALPPGCIQVSLRRPLEATPDFSLDNLDLLAYPVAARAVPPPCQAAMRALPVERRGAVLESAGESRLRLRAAILREAMADRGRDQVVYEETMAALGYRPNRIPFRRLARLLPLDALRAHAAGDPVRAYALLLGASGLLPDPTVARRDWDDDTRAFVRRCWDVWFPEASAFLGRALAKSDWTLAGMRPANRPERRLMAAALLFGGATDLAQRLAAWAAHPETATPDALLDAWALPAPPYWARRYAWGGPLRPEPVALLGEGRIREILLNLVVPGMAALGAPADAWLPLARALPPGERNALHAETALRLFGPDHSPRHYRTGLRLQGLVHVHHEYCLGDRSRCAACPVPNILKGLANAAP